MIPTRLGILIILLTMLTEPASAQQQRYIEDTALLPLRSEASSGSSPVHQGLPSGSPVTLIQGDTGAGWSQVRTREGVDGWIQTRYLRRDPGARYQILNAMRLMGQPEDGTVSLTQAIEQLSGQLQAITGERDKLQAELAEGRQVWNRAGELDTANRELSEEVQALKSRIDVLQAENRRLTDESWQKWFINGVWATGVGGLLTLLLPRFFSRRRRYSEWA
jgi:SH3 domain protein